MRTGLWIPVEIEVLPLSLTEKVLLSEIVSLDRVGECFASNEHFSKLLGVRSDSVSRLISKLKKAGYLKQIGFDGRRRKLLPTLPSGSIALKPNQAEKRIDSKPSQACAVSKGRVGKNAEAAFAIFNAPLNRVQKKYNVQRTWDEFLRWSGNLAPSTRERLQKLSGPESLLECDKVFWNKFTGWNEKINAQFNTINQ
jgi:DNA-binding Lrp family transcriptional regulator